MNLDKLKGHVPDEVIAQIPGVQEKFAVNTPLRLAHFLAQCGHESGGFKFKSENLNYSAEILRKVFPKYFPDIVVAKQYERKPEAIASKVYGGRMGNGPEATKEGFKFKGRGYIQLTGKENYKAFDATVEDDILANPDLVATKYPLLSAAWFWNSRKLNAIADQGATDDVVTKVTKLVNGGTIGLAAFKSATADNNRPAACPMVTTTILVDSGCTTKLTHPHDNRVFPHAAFDKILDKVTHAFIKAWAVACANRIEDVLVIIPATKVDFDTGNTLFSKLAC